VAEYYSPRAKKRWCLSLYDNVGHHALGVFPQAAMVSFFVLVIFSFYFSQHKKEEANSVDFTDHV
jgi:hypothetical protein